MSFGTEWATEKYQYFLYENLYLSQPGQGKLARRPVQRRRAGQELPELFSANGSLAFKKTAFGNRDGSEHHQVFIGRGLSNEFRQSKQAYTFGNVWSPRIGFSYKVGKAKNLFASISKGFSVPSVAETLTPEGQINTDLKTGSRLELRIGIQGELVGKPVICRGSHF